MSQSENCENLLIDFNNITVSDGPSEMDEIKLTTEAVSESSSTKQTINSILCSSQPLYKLLAESSNDVGDNNPFDHFDKQAGLLDDPFEIVENAALISLDSATKMPDVETATLISFDSTMSDSSKAILLTNDSQSTICNETKLNDSVQNTSQKQMSAIKNISQKTISSPSGSSTRSKAKNTSVTLLKYSLSNSRLDLIATDNVSSPGEENRQKLEMRRDSGTDDSFDDIWSTKPNLIDSQTEIDIESDIDNDIAKLNIPMLKITTPVSQSEENDAPDPVNSETKESVETKALNRCNILEKFASIKQKIPQSPASIHATLVPSSSPPSTIPIQNQTVDVYNESQLRDNFDNETITTTQDLPNELLHQQQRTVSDNTDSLIENLQRLVDQCDDKRKQITAKHLLDDLSSILTKTIANEKNNGKKTDALNRQPPKIKRQGTFSIDREKCTFVNSESLVDEMNCSDDRVRNETQIIDSKFSEVVKQIQNAFGSHQNINVLQTNDHPMKMSSEVAAVNPTYIVVMAPPPPPPPSATIDYGGESAFSRFQRSRSQSFTLTAMHANQQKIEQSRAQPTAASATPTKGFNFLRRRSFSTITQPVINSETQAIVKPAVNQHILMSDAPKILRRRSLHGPIEKQDEPDVVQAKQPISTTRRRSFQVTSTGTGIRLPSPKKSFNLGRGSTTPPRQNTYTSGALARRKSFTTETVKDSPLKMKTSYGIIKKPAVPPATRNLRIRVSQSTTGRTTAPLRAVVPMKQVAPLHLINDTVAPVDDKRKMSTLITSTPRSIPSPIKKKDPSSSSSSASTLPVESPIQNLHENIGYLSTPPNTSVQPIISNVAQRRRTISDYRNQVNSSVSVTSDSNSGGKISNLKNATKTLATGLSRFTAKKMSSIGLKRPSNSASKENKQP